VKWIGGLESALPLAALAAPRLAVSKGHAAMMDRAGRWVGVPQNVWELWRGWLAGNVLIPPPRLASPAAASVPALEPAPPRVALVGEREGVDPGRVEEEARQHWQQYTCASGAHVPTPSQRIYQHRRRDAAVHQAGHCRGGQARGVRKR
jgi:hypothetical protein